MWALAHDRVPLKLNHRSGNRRIGRGQRAKRDAGEEHHPVFESLVPAVSLLRVDPGSRVFESNLLDSRFGTAVWDAVAAAGEEFGIRPIAPCEARRIEAGIFNYGCDMTLDDTPFQITGMERLVESQEQDYLAKEALERLRETGVDRKLVGMFLEGDQLRAELSRSWPVISGGDEVGCVTHAVWSPASRRTSATCGSRSSWPNPGPGSKWSPKTEWSWVPSLPRSRSSTR